ncbi:hypothetical protein ACM258_17755 [Phaeobacter piscinae]
MIEQDYGIDGLRRFFGEINAELPEVYDALRLRGMIHHCPLDLATKRRQHFPQFD